MARPNYATVADYIDSDYSDGQPVTDERALTKLLSRASRHIEGLTVTANYATDEDGAPEDLNILEAFRDAVCAQVAYWDETGDVSGAMSSAGSASIGSLSLSSDKSAGQTPGDRQAVRYAPEAVEILSSAGLCSSRVGR